MKDWFKSYFYYSKTERKGALLLTALALLLALLPALHPLFSHQPEADLEKYAEAVAAQADAEPPTNNAPAETPALFYFDPNTLPFDSLLMLGLSGRTASTIIKYRQKVSRFSKPEDLQRIYTLAEGDYKRLRAYVRIAEPKSSEKSAPAAQASEAQQFYFDPNTTPGDSLRLLGLPDRTVQTLLNYRSKGGRFRRPEDLRKIYGLPEADAERLIPYVQIASAPAKPERASAEPPTPVRPAPAEAVQLDINAASPSEWQQLRGIGPAYARRICNFRDKLGGFAQIEQVAETYGLPDSTFQHIRPHLRTDGRVRTLPINQAGAAELRAHPYLSWKQANAIIAYRSQHGAFRSESDVAKIRSIPREVLQKMAPYWSFE
jgi:competence ComEA-like helix-hairpin-helix protein